MVWVGGKIRIGQEQFRGQRVTVPDVQSPTSLMRSIGLILFCRRGAQRVNKGGRCAGIYALFVHGFHSIVESARTHKGLATVSQVDDV